MGSSAFWAHWAWAAATAVIGVIFASLLLSQYMKKRKEHQLAWFVGFLFYALAAAMEAYSEYTGAWDHTVYRIYIVIAASLVGFLGLGSVYLIARKKIWGHLFLAFNLLVMALFFYGVFTTELIAKELVAGITVSGKPLGASGTFPRLYSMFVTIPGSLLLLGGSLLSIFRFIRKKEYRYRVWANVLIIAGTTVIAGIGGMVRSGSVDGLYPAEMIGATLLLLGFLKAGSLKKGASAIREKRAAEKEVTATTA
ncbi:MAG TPA: hypothetical protein VE439_10755 [Anaerolineae bacterium]|nr:hypothetical protein [Anaerolineae bacterium]